MNFIEMYFDEPEPEKPYTPPYRPKTEADIASEIQDLFWCFGEGGEYSCQRTPNLNEIQPLADKLIDMLKNQSSGQMANVIKSYEQWRDGGKNEGRAWSMKQAAKQLSDMFFDSLLNEPVVDDDLPF